MDYSKLKRDIYPIPDDVMQIFNSTGTFSAYKLRPPYQQNDYIGWIGRAKRNETREKRINQMVAELRTGDTYMGMRYNAKT
ncbi:MAG: YdeI/OmpD-associated family protein [Mobilitalea sp.]